MYMLLSLLKSLLLISSLKRFKFLPVSFVHLPPIKRISIVYWSVRFFLTLKKSGEISHMHTVPITKHGYHQAFVQKYPPNLLQMFKTMVSSVCIGSTLAHHLKPLAGCRRTQHCMCDARLQIDDPHVVLA